MNEIPVEYAPSAARTRVLCRQMVRALIARGGWTSVTEDELVERVAREAGPDATAGALDRLAKYHYSALLYAACLDRASPQKRETAFRDLHRFLYRAAYNRWPELAEDAAQRALVLVYEQLDRCREPGTFLAFALNKLRHAFQQERRARESHEPLLDDETSAAAADDDGGLPHQNASDGRGQGLHESAQEQELLSDERLLALARAVERLADARQRAVVLWKFFGGMSDEEIARELGIQPGHVRVLRHRGVAALRADSVLRDAL